MVPAQPRPPTRPERSEAFWSTFLYIIVGLGLLMLVAIALAVIVALRIVPWS